MFDPNSKFLVVDDFKTMRSIVKKNLQQIGFTHIDEAEDGEAALALLQKAFAENTPYHCVVSDWNMPKMSGLELLVKVRTDARMKGLPFVLVTAENEQAQVIEAAKAGVSNYIVKPFNPNDFRTKLQAAYDKHKNAKAA